MYCKTAVSIGSTGVAGSLPSLSISESKRICWSSDGIVAIRPDEAPATLAATQAQARKEAEILASIEAGTYAGAYAK